MGTIPEGLESRTGLLHWESLYPRPSSHSNSLSLCPAYCAPRAPGWEPLLHTILWGGLWGTWVSGLPGPGLWGWAGRGPGSRRLTLSTGSPSLGECLFPSLPVLRGLLGCGGQRSNLMAQISTCCALLLGPQGAQAWAVSSLECINKVLRRGASLFTLCSWGGWCGRGNPEFIVQFSLCLCLSHYL